MWGAVGTLRPIIIIITTIIIIIIIIVVIINYILIGEFFLHPPEFGKLALLVSRPSAMLRMNTTSYDGVVDSEERAWRLPHRWNSAFRTIGSKVCQRFRWNSAFFLSKVCWLRTNGVNTNGAAAKEERGRLVRTGWDIRRSP